jgi:hypothetical protein
MCGLDVCMLVESGYSWLKRLVCSPRYPLYVSKLFEIEPNYRHSIQTIFIDASVRILTIYKALHFFHYFSVLDNLPDPSYPSLALTARLLSQHHLDNYLYKAHSCESTEISVNSTNSELIAKGRSID